MPRLRPLQDRVVKVAMVPVYGRSWQQSHRAVDARTAKLSHWAMRSCESESVLWPQVALTLQALVPAHHAAPCPLVSPCNGCPLESRASTELNSRPCTKSTRRARYAPTQWLRAAQPVTARKTSVSRRCSHCQG
jgi:hypothetical protein